MSSLNRDRLCHSFLNEDDFSFNEDDFSFNGDDNDVDPNQVYYTHDEDSSSNFSDPGSYVEESHSTDENVHYNLNGLDNADNESHKSSWSEETSPTKHLHEHKEASLNIASSDLHSEQEESSFTLSSQSSESESSNFDDELSSTSPLEYEKKNRVARKATPLHHMKEADFDATLQSLLSPPKKFNTSTSNILFVGLWYSGFNADRQMKSNLNRNMRRFLTFFGVGPRTIQALYTDLLVRNPSLMFKDLMMTMNWFKLYDQEPVLEGRWGFCSEYIGPKLKETGRMIQALLPEKIKFEFSNDDTIIMSLDTVNYTIQEPRKTPSTSWYDPKSASAGLVSP